MQNGVLSTNGLKTRDRTPLITKIGLAVVFLLGLVVIFLGYRGIQEYNASGFSSETAYHAIYALSGDVNTAWEKKLQPQRDALSAEKRDALDEAAKQLLFASWENQKTGGQADAEALLSGEKDEAGLLYRLLYTTYLVNGPKVSTGNKKEIAALNAADAEAFRQGLLNCLTDEAAERIAKLGGLVGITFHAPHLSRTGTATLRDAVSHILYGFRLIPQAIALGSDFDGTDLLPDGLSSSDDLPALAAALSDAGLPDAGIDAVFSRNADRFFTRF